MNTRRKGDFVMYGFIFVGFSLAVFTLLLNWVAYTASNSIASQDIPADLICFENWNGPYICESKEDLLFPHLYE